MERDGEYLDLRQGGAFFRVPKSGAGVNLYMTSCAEPRVREGSGWRGALRFSLFYGSSSVLSMRKLFMEVFGRS